MSATTIPRTIRKRVRRGARRLDYAHPGWAGKIDVDKLDIANPNSCIVGQLRGDFNDHYDGLGLPGLSIQNGMHMNGTYFRQSPSRAEARKLTLAWKAEIKARRMVEPPRRTFANWLGDLLHLPKAA